METNDHSVRILMAMALDLMKGKYEPDRAEHILKDAPGSSEIGVEDWCTIYDYRNRPDRMLPAVLRTLENQIDQWFQLGEPGNHEDWALAIEEMCHIQHVEDEEYQSFSEAGRDQTTYGLI